MDSSQITQIATVLREHVIDLFLNSCWNIYTIGIWTLIYFIFGSVLGWVADRVLRELSSNRPRALLTIPLKDRLCNLIVIVFTLIGLKLGLDKCDIDVRLFLYGGGSLPFLLLSWALQAPLANYFASWTNQFLLGGDVIQIGSVSGTVEFVGMLHVHLRTKTNQIVRVPQAQFQNISVTFTHSSEHSHAH